MNENFDTFKQNVANIVKRIVLDQIEKQIHKLENVIDLYDKLETAEDKNILLKSILAKVTYLKTEKAIKKNSDPTNFIINLYPKINKANV